jgi:hypothetical protein
MSSKERFFIDSCNIAFGVVLLRAASYGTIQCVTTEESPCARKIFESASSAQSGSQERIIHRGQKVRKINMTGEPSGF